MAKVFLCHSSADKPFTRRLATSLTAFGVETWLDEAEILPGDSLIGKIEHGLSASDYLMAILSPASVVSEWCTRELRSALTFEIAGRPLTVIPVIAQRCQIPPFLLDKLYVDFTDDYGAALSRLLAAFLGRGDVAGLSPTLVNKWTERMQRPTPEDFTRFVAQELDRQRVAARRQAFVSAATSEDVFVLLAPGDFDRNDRQRLAKVALAYSCTSQCTGCDNVVIEIEKLTRQIRRDHAPRLDAAEIETRLRRFASSSSFPSPAGVCDTCFIYRYNSNATD